MKPTFTGSPTLDERFGFKPTTVVDVTPEIDPSEPPKEEDVWEAPSGYLRCARHQVFSLLLIRRDGVQLMVPYRDRNLDGEYFTHARRVPELGGSCKKKALGLATDSMMVTLGIF